MLVKYILSNVVLGEVYTFSSFVYAMYSTVCFMRAITNYENNCTPSYYFHQNINMDHEPMFIDKSRNNGLWYISYVVLTDVHQAIAMYTDLVGEDVRFCRLPISQIQRINGLV